VPRSHHRGAALKQSFGGLPLRSLAPSRPVALEAIVARLLAKRAEERYQSASDVAEALGAVNTKPSGWRRLFRS